MSIEHKLESSLKDLKKWLDGSFTGELCYQWGRHRLTEAAIQRDEAKLSTRGALTMKTGAHTGRAAKDKYVVKGEEAEANVWWGNQVLPMTEETFDRLFHKILAHYSKRDTLFACTKKVGAHPKYSLGVNLVSTGAVYNLFADNLFRALDGTENSDLADYTIFHAPTLEIDNFAEWGLRSKTVITTCFRRKMVLICGTQYSGEIKKSAFSLLNYLLPDRGIFPMHAGANEDLSDGGVSIFFGLSGTGKTTLSTDEGKSLIGDDEHGLSDEGTFNFEGGCYAKTYKLSEETEPDIYRASMSFGAIFENVKMDEHTGELDFFDKSITENGRVSYPLGHLPQIVEGSKAGIPRNIFFLTADAFGVLPAVASLSSEEAMYYFLLGYTSKLAGTEVGVKEPQTTFSTCFGAPFMLRYPKVYADLLKKYLDGHSTRVWLVNTGWTNGAYGEGGERFPLKVTRNIIRSIQRGDMDEAQLRKDPILGFSVPTHVEGIPEKYLNPALGLDGERLTRYQKLARDLLASFEKQHEWMMRQGEGAAAQKPAAAQKTPAPLRERPASV